MKRASKKLISLLLALCMLAGMIPMYAVTTSAATYTASSWSDLKNKVASASSGDTIQFTRLDPTSNTDTITINKRITISGVNGDGKIKRNNGDAGNGIYVPDLTFFKVVSGGTLILDGISFYNDHGGSVPAIIIESGGTVETVNTGFWNFRSTDKGGAIRVNSGGTLTMKGQNSKWTSDCRTITGSETTNSGSKGGAIYNEGTVKILTGSSASTLIKNCKTNNGYGGAIYNAGTLYIEAQPGNAAAIYGFDSQSTTASYFGAAIYNTGTVELAGKISNCSSAVFAGGIHNNGGTVNIRSGAVIEGMYAAASAGAIYNENNGTVNVYGGEIKNSSAPGVGGAIYNNGGKINMTGGTLSGNNAPQGGAIYNAGTTTISGGTLSGNTSTEGGAIYNISAVTITGGTFNGNTATNGGGAILAGGGTVITSGARYEQNKATGSNSQGGAILVTARKDSNNNIISTGIVNVTGGFFTSNSSTHVGGAIARVGGGTLNITGTGFSWNAATTAGDDLYTDVSGESCGVTFSAYSFNTHQNRGYCVYYDRPNGDADNVDYFSTGRVGVDYPPNAGGYKFLPVTVVDQKGTVGKDAYSVSIGYTENGASHATINGYSTTLGGYTAAEKWHLLNSAKFTSKTIETTYGIVTYDTTNNKIVYTLKPAYQHRENSFSETFYYDAKTPINSGDNSHYGYAEVKVTVEGKGHTFTNNTQTIAPTCKADGYTKHTCSNCSYTYNDNVIKASAAYHNWTNETVTKQPTCQPGEKTFTCSHCGQTKKETIAANGTHNFTNAAIKQVDKDNHAKQCTICKDWVNEAHTWTTTSYTTEGITVTVKTCNICGYVSRTYSGASVPTMIVGQGTTTANSTVTIPVRLLKNPGIWAQNFIIYYPENLELTNVSSSTDLYPDTGVISTKEIDATANARVTNAMLEANVSPAGMKALIYYVENDALENVTGDGDIVYLTFTVPANAISSYNVGIVGIDDDAIDQVGNNENITYVNGKINITNGNSCSHTTSATADSVAANCSATGYEAQKCSTCGNIISSTVTPKNENHNYSNGQTYPATCTEAGYTVKTCTRCGKVSKVTDASKPATGHNLGTATIIKQPTGMSAGINRQQCLKCDYYKDIAFETAKNTGTSTGDGLTYQYKLVSEIKPGHDYVISNKNTAGSAVVMSAKSGDSSIQNADATITGNTIVVDDTAAVWTATSSSEGVYLTNKSTGQYLSGFQNTKNQYFTHLNIGVSDDPFKDPSTFLFKNGASNKNDFGFYLGWEDYLTKTTKAEPQGTYMKAANWTSFTSSQYANRGHLRVILDTHFEIEFDASFENADTRVRFFMPTKRVNNSAYYDTYFFFDLTPSQFYIGAKDYTANNYSTEYPWGLNGKDAYGYEVGSYTPIESDGYDYKQWNHYKLVVENGIATGYVNDVQVVSMVLPAGFHNSDGCESITLTNYHYWPENSVTGEWWMNHPIIGIDNMSIVTYNNDTTTKTDDNKATTILGGNEKLEFFYDFEDGNQNGVSNLVDPDIAYVDAPVGNYSIGVTELIAQDKFIASSDSENKVYFYEKQEVGSAAEVYQRASELVPGEKYVIVSDNLEGTGKSFISNSGGAVGGKTVYSDAISYDPYVTLADASGYEFVFAGSADGGYLVNAASGGKYLKADGTVTATATADNIIDVTKNANGNMVIKIGGTNYYLYKRVVINKIDTDLVNDISVVDFGWGFVLDGDSDLRNNDSWNGKWTDKTTAKMTLSSLATGVSGTKNNHFYKTAKGTGRVASLTNTNYTASVGSNKITYSPKGKYETEQTFTYEFTITNIASYIYGDVTVIPATTVYYEETANMFTYNGTWSTVGSTKDTVGLLLDKHYGKSDTYANDATFSAGGAKYAKVTNGDYTKSVSFKFKGTGFELFSATSGATGPVFVTVTGPNNYAKYIFVDTNFGYTYDQENDKWVSNGYTSGTMGQYQVPVVKLMDLTYGEYNVLVEPSYDAMTDHANLGYSDFYFDGVRVFDPLGTSLSSTAKAAYKADKEYAPKVISLRQYLASGSNMALYLDGKTLSGDKDVIASDYKSLGANNEVQLGSMGTVAFNVKTSGTAPAKVSIGIKLASGTTGKVTVKGGNVTKEITVNSATDMYYDITDVYNALGNGTMIVTNSNTGAVVSLTTLKYSYNTEPTSTSSLALYSNSRTAKNANRMMRAVYNVKDETFTAGDVNSDGKINAMDILTLKRYLAGYIELSETELKAADVNGDGKVNSRDILALKAMM